MRCMPHDAAWLEARARELAHKRELLAALEEKLAAWQSRIELQDLPAEKRRALDALAQESVATLQSMIERLNSELAPGEQLNGQLKPPAPDGWRG